MKDFRPEKTFCFSLINKKHIFRDIPRFWVLIWIQFISLVMFLTSFVDGKMTSEFILPNTPENIFNFKSTVTSQNGTFSTSKLVPQQKAVYRFKFRSKTDEVVWIMWSEFHLDEPSGANKQCLRSFVEVIIIDYYNVEHVTGRYCGNIAPPNYTTMQYAVDLVFSTSGSKLYQGFKGTYHFIPEKAVPPPPSIYPGNSNPHAHGCGGIAQGLHGGVIKSPGYPETYPSGVDCNWVIRVNPEMKIFIKVLQLELTPSIAQCEDARLVVLDGYAHVANENLTFPSTYAHQRIVFCGESKYHNDEGLKSVMSDRNRMNIRFKTTKPPPTETKIRRRDFDAPIGFYLVWTEVSVKDECDKFYCRGGEYCIDEGKKVCAERKRYCIDTSLVCDGIPNCAESDDSDEDNCYSKQIIIVCATLLGLLLFVIVAVVCCQRRRSRKFLRRAGQDAVGERRRHNRGSHSSSMSSVNHSDADEGGSSGDRYFLHVPESRRFVTHTATQAPSFDQNSTADSKRSDSIKKEPMKVALPNQLEPSMTCNEKPENLHTENQMKNFQDKNSNTKRASISVNLSGAQLNSKAQVDSVTSSDQMAARMYKICKSRDNSDSDDTSDDGDMVETSFIGPIGKSVRSASYRHPAANRLPSIRRPSRDPIVWHERGHKKSLTFADQLLPAGESQKSWTVADAGTVADPARRPSNSSTKRRGSEILEINSPLWREFTTDSVGTAELNIIQRRPSNFVEDSQSNFFCLQENLPDDSHDLFNPRPPPSPLTFQDPPGTCPAPFFDFHKKNSIKNAKPIQCTSKTSKQCQDGQPSDSQATVNRRQGGILKQPAAAPAPPRFKSTVTVDIPSNSAENPRNQYKDPPLTVERVATRRVDVSGAADTQENPTEKFYPTGGAEKVILARSQKLTLHRPQRYTVEEPRLEHQKSNAEKATKVKPILAPSKSLDWVRREPVTLEPQHSHRTMMRQKAVEFTDQNFQSQAKVYGQQRANDVNADRDFGMDLKSYSNPQTFFENLEESTANDRQQTKNQGPWRHRIKPTIV